MIVMSEFRLVQLTSSLTLSIFGVLKEIITVLLAVWLGDHFSPVNAVGVVLCIAGNIVYFSKRAHTNKRAQANEKRADFESVLGDDGDERCELECERSGFGQACWHLKHGHTVPPSLDASKGGSDRAQTSTPLMVSPEPKEPKGASGTHQHACASTQLSDMRL